MEIWKERKTRINRQQGRRKGRKKRRGRETKKNNRHQDEGRMKEGRGQEASKRKER